MHPKLGSGVGQDQVGLGCSRWVSLMGEGRGCPCSHDAQEQMRLRKVPAALSHHACAKRHGGLPRIAWCDG